MKHRDYSPGFTAETRLIEWADARDIPPWNAWPSQNVFQRLRTDRRNAAPGAQGSSFDIIEPDAEGGCSVAVVKDGGVGAMVDRMYEAISKANRVEEMAHALNGMPKYYRALVDATYDRAGARENYPAVERVAEKLGVSRATYYRHKERMLLWLACQLCIPGAPEAAKAASCKAA